MSEKNVPLKFRRKRLWQVLLFLIAVTALAIGLMALVPPGQRLLRKFGLSMISKQIGMVIAGSAAGIYLLFSMINWRCPGCKKFLWLRLFASKCNGCDASFAKDGQSVAAIDSEDSQHSKVENEPVVTSKKVEPHRRSNAPVAKTSKEKPNTPQRRASDPGFDHEAREQLLERAGKSLVRCVACPRCGSGSFRKKRPDKVLPIFRIRECRNCNQRYKGPTSKKACLIAILAGAGLMLPLLLQLNKYTSIELLLKDKWPLAIPAGIGVLVILVALKKMLLQRMIKPPHREHGRRSGDIRNAYETTNLLLTGVSPNPAASFEPIKDETTPAKATGTEGALATGASATTTTTGGSLWKKEKKENQAMNTPIPVGDTVGSKAAETTGTTATMDSPAPVLNTSRSADSGSRHRLREGCVIPAHPLALNASRQFDERRMRALTRYYLAAGAGGVAVGVHTTQFAIREQPNDLFRHVLEQTMGELFDHEMNHQTALVKVAGICGETKQAIDEAELAAGLGYDAGLLNLGAMKDANNDRLLWHCREVAKAIPVFGFFLSPSVGGRQLDFDFWRQFAEIENVVAIKIAAFNRYDTVNVVRAVAEAGRAIEVGSDNPEGIALYTGNDDHIVGDLLGEWTYDVADRQVTQRIVGGLLGHWAVWTKAAVDTFDSIRSVNAADKLPKLSTALDRQVTDMNAAIFDAAHQFKGCVPGVHEVLRRQGLLEGNWCLDPNETLSPGQAEEITRVAEAYPHLTDDEFVAEHRDQWLR